MPRPHPATPRVAHHLEAMPRPYPATPSVAHHFRGHASPGVIHANAVDVWINRAGQDIRRRRVRRPYGTHLRGGESRISGSDQQGSNHQGHDRHDVDQDVHTRAGGVFERIANRVADNCRGMSIGALAA